MAITTYIFAGGGTGGHLYPAIAIAQALDTLAQHQPNRGERQGGTGIEHWFLCSDRAIDSRILTAQGVRFFPSPARPLAGSLRGVARLMASWGPAVRHARRLIQDAKRRGPVEVIAMGGFVAAPCVQGARAERIRVRLVNLDAVPGKANRWIARHSVEVYSATPVDLPLASGCTIVPPVVRAQALAGLSKDECMSRLGLDPGKRVLMITGGSQGAATLNDLGAGLSAKLDGSGWQVLHQTGKPENGAIASAYERAGVKALVQEYVSQMALWWGSADLAIARAGAGNVGEAWANHVPCVFMPYPFHRDQHQRHNAQRLHAAHAAWIRTDHIDPAANMHDAGRLVLELCQPTDALSRAKASLNALGPADGALQIARRLIST